AARDPFSARAVIFALFLDADAGKAANQLDQLSRTDPPLATETRRLSPAVAALGLGARLPLFDRCVPVLRRLTPTQLASFLNDVQVLVRADGEVNLNEFILAKLIE